ncbi:peptidase M16 inactive domain-containing protein [Infundibulicybe gibba]|nr:peptidase M16 inactive domain-containing protein [Infundibulicybe gibba]
MGKGSQSLLRHTYRSCRRNDRRTFSSSPRTSTVQITTLPNKIRIATESTPCHFSSLGFIHFLDRMAFKSTSSRTDTEMTTAIHSLGGQIITVLNPSFLPEELEAQRDAAFYEVREISSKPDMVLPEVLHNVAYNQKGLGNSLLCPEERINVLDSETLKSSMREWYRPERMVIAGAGMQHELLVELADKHFSSLTPSPTLSPQSQPIVAKQPVSPRLLSPASPSVGKSLTRAASYLFPNSLTDSPSYLNPTSTYTGGYRYIRDTSTEFDHLYIAFEGVGIHDDDIFALATMQVLLGGGGSFSAGNVLTVYTHILNHFPQVDHCASFHHIYTDSSLFGLFASFVPASSGLRGGNTPGQILPHLVNQLSLLLYTQLPEVELSRAKNQLKSSLMMALESKAIEVEDMGRQILVHNRQVPVTEMTAKIDQVQSADIRRVAARLFGPQSGNKATVICMGHEELGSWEDVFKKYSVAGV